MDEMTIQSKLMKAVINRWLRRKVEKSLGIDVIFNIQDLKITMIDEDVYGHINVEVNTNREGFDKILKKFDL